MERLNEKHEGESPKVTLRMDPSMIKVVDREAKRIDGTRSAALRSLVMRATGAGVTAEVSELKARLEKAEHERDEAIAQRKEADRSAKREREDLITSRNAVMLERDTLKSHLASVETERDDALARVEKLSAELDAYTKEVSGELRKINKEFAQMLGKEYEPTDESDPTDDTARNTSLRARWHALKQPLRAFVSKHSITRTPFQKWAAGERDMHGETLQKYEAAIRSEES
jgi:chromosome segregation ATPase